MFAESHEASRGPSDLYLAPHDQPGAGRPLSTTGSAWNGFTTDSADAMFIHGVRIVLKDTAWLC
jgi:hypothetical protein